MKNPKKKATGGWSPFKLFWISLLGVVVWPLLGIAASYHLFDNPSEAAFLFGGFSGILLFPVAMLFQVLFGMSGIVNIVFTSLLISIWLLMWLIPIGWLIKHPRNRRIQSLFMVILSGASLFQAALGYLMILGKGV